MDLQPISLKMSQEIKKRFSLVLQSKTFERAVRTLHLSDKRVLDLGCGYGEYMQRFGSGSVGITTNSSEVAYGKENGLDIRFGNVEFLKETVAISEQFDAFWANNLFEHLRSPHSFLAHLKEHSHKDSILILGVPVIPKVSSLVRIPKFRGALASPHINFFTKETLSQTVERAGWKVRSTHVYLIAENDPTYRYPEKKVKEWVDDPHYTDLLSIMR
jgi:cyclopropane fatty-acyl-phospholipid synthase-like methyltransferase